MVRLCESLRRELSKRDRFTPIMQLSDFHNVLHFRFQGDARTEMA